MTATEYHEVMSVIRALDDKLTHHRYSDDRKGMIPPAAIEDCVQDIGDAFVTISMILRPVTTRQLPDWVAERVKEV